MKFIVKLFPEITIKSNSVRLRFIKMLAGNIRNVLKPHSEAIAVQRHWDYIEVRSKKTAAMPNEAIAERLTQIPGIHHILAVEEIQFTDLHHIYELVLPYFAPLIENKTFCVRIKRRGQHEFSSLDAERYIGGGLNQAVASAKVQLKNPDFTVLLEIEEDKLLLVKQRLNGLGGFPLGTQEDVFSLISGGFDSGVSSYMFIRRGCRVHYCFFNLGGAMHEIGVKQMAHALWQQFGSSHKVRFVTVDFAEVVGEILEKIDNGQMGVVLKRMMMRAASQIAVKYRIESLVTGEALGQVSSQTLTNLRLIDEASQCLVLRPLITYDKENIIDLARQIGTADMAKTMPEYCGVISKSPTVKAVKEKIEREEAKFDFSILEKAVLNAKNQDIRDIAKTARAQVPEIESFSNIDDQQIIIDIRAPEETEQRPFTSEKAPVLTIPFYRLASEFPKLDQTRSYLLYCEKGVMSQLQALYLQELGFNNIALFKKEV